MVAYANFETGRPIRLTVEREGKQIELILNLRPGSLGDLEWGGWQVIGGPHAHVREAKEVTTATTGLVDYDPRKHIFNTGNSRTFSSLFAKQYDVA